MTIMERVTKVRNWFNCSTGSHYWTSKADQGIPATREELEDPIAGFASYSKMYCSKCGYVYKGNLS